MMNRLYLLGILSICAYTRRGIRHDKKVTAIFGYHNNKIFDGGSDQYPGGNRLDVYLV